MDSFVGIVVLLIIFGLVQKFSEKAQANRNAPVDSGKRRAPSSPAAAKRPAKADALSSAADLLDGAILKGKPGESFNDIIEAFSQAFSPEEGALPNPEKPAPAAAKANLPQGASLTDAHGCVGGSMDSHPLEGEDPQEHAAHLRRSDSARPTPSTPHIAVPVRPRRSATAEKARTPEATGEPLCGVMRGATVADLRRAVVMSEILDKPKALRRTYR